eukprot:511981-Karenia_brevis.AAC.1
MPNSWGTLNNALFNYHRHFCNFPNFSFKFAARGAGRRPSGTPFWQDCARRLTERSSRSISSSSSSISSGSGSGGGRSKA